MATFEVLGQLAASVDEVVEDEYYVVNEDDLLEEEGLYDVKEQLKWLAVARAAQERLGLLDGALRMCIRRCHSELRLEKVQGSTQTAVTDHFGPRWVSYGPSRRIHTLVMSMNEPLLTNMLITRDYCIK